MPCQSVKAATWKSCKQIHLIGFIWNGRLRCHLFGCWLWMSLWSWWCTLTLPLLRRVQHSLWGETPCSAPSSLHYQTWIFFPRLQPTWIWMLSWRNICTVDVLIYSEVAEVCRLCLPGWVDSAVSLSWPWHKSAGSSTGVHSPLLSSPVCGSPHLTCTSTVLITIRASPA